MKNLTTPIILWLGLSLILITGGCQSEKPLKESLPPLVKKEIPGPPPLPVTPEPSLVALSFEDRSLTEEDSTGLISRLEIRWESPEVVLSRVTVALPSRDIRMSLPETETAAGRRGEAARYLWTLPLAGESLPLEPLEIILQAKDHSPLPKKIHLTGPRDNAGPLFTAVYQRKEPIMLNPPFQMDATRQGDMMMVYFDTADRGITHMEFRLWNRDGRSLGSSPLYKAQNPRGTNSYLMDPLDFPHLRGFEDVAYLEIVPHSRRTQDFLEKDFSLVSPRIPVN